ncbi:glutamine synthetase family protein [Spartinivicinus ruber]|uniref:glutamine synthetase family protein n=1 Tax=Spartinivicinus ruber TaxID=2683272 RepID=UPI0013D6277F|nr:glutamine synthetase [Spartinivicinus ruber]
MADPITARQVANRQDLAQLVKERELSHIKVGLFDLDGLMRGKYMSRDKFFKAVDSGFSFCDVILGWDIKDQLYDNVSYTGWHTGYPDAAVELLPNTCRELPLEDNMLLILGQLTGRAEALCPRGLLRRVLQTADDMGYQVKAAFEYEFFLFDETPDSAHEKGFRQLKPATPDYFGYSILRNSVHAQWYHEILNLAESMDFPIEGLHTETGPGVLEAALSVDDALNAADKAALFKTFIKVWAQKNQRMATFMAKWSNEYPGQSGHIHLSLVDKNTGQPVFYAADQKHTMSEVQRYFIGGLQQQLPEFLPLLAPTINSYRRLIPGFWAPTHATWGFENRTTAIRVISGGEQSQRLEMRLGAADANPYLALAATIAGGLLGVRSAAEPSPAIVGNAYDTTIPEEQALPATLWEAAQRFRQSSVARDYFGTAFVEHFAASREWEVREFQKHITDWELERYFEII